MIMVLMKTMAMRTTRVMTEGEKDGTPGVQLTSSPLLLVTEMMIEDMIMIIEDYDDDEGVDRGRKRRHLG